MVIEREEVVIEPKLNLKAVETFRDRMDEALKIKKQLESVGGSSSAYFNSIKAATAEAEKNAKKIASMTGGNASHLLPKSAGGFLSQLGEATTGSAQNLLAGVGGVFPSIGAGALQGGMSGGFAGALAGGASAGITAVVDKLSEFFRSIPGLVGKANPATLKMFTDVFDDIEATLGHRLIPIVKYWTEEMRLLADALMTLLPDQEDFTKVMDEYKPILNEVKLVLQDIAPVIKTVLVYGLKLVAGAVHALGVVIKTVSEIVRSDPLFVLATKFIGGGGGKELKSSFGAAAGHASIVSGQELGRRTIIAALSTGASPMEKTAENTGKTVTLLDRLLGFFGKETGPRSAHHFPRDMSENQVPQVTN